MALINGALQIGKSAMTAAQAALQVTGNNLANAATPSYSRQTVHLAPTQYTEVIPGKYTGTGVQLYEIRRQVDDALNGRIRAAAGDMNSSLVQQQAMSRVEATFNELTSTDLSSRINSFFGAWTTLQSQPDSSAQRDIVLQEGQGLTNYITEVRDNLSSIQKDLDEQLRFNVDQADTLAEKVAEMNRMVVTSEAGRAGSSAALRDQRDELLRQLSEMINITTREADGGAVNVFIGNEPLIQYDQNRGLTYRETVDSNGVPLAQVIFRDTNQAVDLSSGKIHGLFAARDEYLGGCIAELDTWTAGLIYEVNQAHSLGRGTSNYTAVTGLYSVIDPDAALCDQAATGLNWSGNNGVFSINVTDQSGATTPYQIQVKAGVDGSDMCLNDLITTINAQLPANVRASIDGGSRFHMEASNGYSFSFSGPETGASNALAILGVNSFFQGTSGHNVAVRDGLNSAFVAASGVAQDFNGPLVGNGANAGKIGELSGKACSSLGGVSFNDYFRNLVGQIATDSRASQDNYTAADTVMQTLEAERQAISGVSVDEEAIAMITYQRAFQGSARYINVINQMLDEIMNLV